MIFADHFFSECVFLQVSYFICLSFCGHRAQHERYCQQGSHLQQLWTDVVGHVPIPSIQSSLEPCPVLMLTPCCHNFYFLILSLEVCPYICPWTLVHGLVQVFPPTAPDLIHFCCWPEAPKLGCIPPWPSERLHPQPCLPARPHVPWLPHAPPAASLGSHFTDQLQAHRESNNLKLIPFQYALFCSGKMPGENISLHLPRVHVGCARPL